MRYRIVISLLLLFVGGSVLAQGGPGPRGEAARKKIKAAKKQFLTEELALSEEQAVKFWPIYDAFENEMEANHRNIKALKKGFNAKSDAQLEQDLNQFFKFKQEEIEIEKKYFKKFQSAITSRQIAVLYKSEQEFKRIILQKIRDRMAGRE